MSLATQSNATLGSAPSSLGSPSYPSSSSPPIPHFRVARFPGSVAPTSVNSQIPVISNSEAGPNASLFDLKGIKHTKLYEID
uniref:Uncharacterized protein n=1 Tax=Lactuca sativa TaxID=4236 RepID=A0A9R1WZC2_LACSA|nr:hypothetical protein LSAT_V11C800399190 [Lactuca sativa]